MVAFIGFGEGSEGKEMNEDGENKEKGFKVEDRRPFDQDGEKKAEAKARFHAPSSGPAEVGEDAGKKEGKASSESEGKYEPIDFKSFLVSQSYVSYMYLGDTPNPESGNVEVNLPAARQMIEFIAMIKEKTKGNLDEEEESLLDSLLSQLRVRYVQKTKKTDKSQ